MVVKYLFLGVVIYAIYRFTNAPKIGSSSADDVGQDEEYTDYEELD